MCCVLSGGITDGCVSCVDATLRFGPCGIQSVQMSDAAHVEETVPFTFPYQRGKH